MGFVESVLYPIISILAYLYFFVIFLEFIAFGINAGKGLTWNDNVLSPEGQKTFSTFFPYNIDYPFEPTFQLSSNWACVANIVNILLWTIPHSVLARPDVKTMVGADPTDQTGIYRSFYVLFATATLHTFMQFWQPMFVDKAPLWDFSKDPLWNMVLTCGYLAGVLFLLSATFAIDHMELVGIKQTTGVDVYGMAGVRAEGFTNRLHYRFIRHPIMTGWLVMFFCVPTMTWNHLLMSVCLSAFIFAEVKFFEEPRLKENFGAQYATYMRNTGSYCPMPFIGMRKRDDAFTPLVNDAEMTS